MSFNVTSYQKSKKLNDFDLLPSAKHCYFCGSVDRSSIFKLQTDPDIYLLKCNICQVVSASRMPTNKALAEYYRDYYNSDIYIKTGEHVTSDDSSRNSRYLTKRILKYIPDTSLKILDFGGGDGSISLNIAMELIESGIEKGEILVVDINKKDIESPDKNIIINSTESLDNIKEKYDFVMASAILEHLPDSHSYIKDLLNHTKTGGLFYARTPSVVPIMRFFSFFGLSFDFTFPGHVHDMGQAFWNNYLSKKIRNGDISVPESTPSIAETTFSTSFFRSLVSRMLKLPWYVLGKRYHMVGGWSIFVKKMKDQIT